LISAVIGNDSTPSFDLIIYQHQLANAYLTELKPVLAKRPEIQ
jgi:hypothetical protein